MLVPAIGYGLSNWNEPMSSSATASQSGSASPPYERMSMWSPPTSKPDRGRRVPSCDQARVARTADADLRTPPSAMVPDIGTGPAEQPIEPGVEPLGVAQRRQVRPGSDECVLGGILREFGVAQDEASGRAQPIDGTAASTLKASRSPRRACSTSAVCTPRSLPINRCGCLGDRLGRLNLRGAQGLAGSFFGRRRSGSGRR